uniref:Uncharacterized protein n=1 Tax=Chromera velia CCMP2878 TaxID=1169474 RepID=A0A0G4I115_9ALVE|eukprot:Cvel_10063.t1-p1 / transcript=Cvel_10063.t1 / gene=Cvel_10063 / organism=Chromera_velia_CCMP2878 / gene_product=hypothetical protein / transcript_product=hypothetical protein / location=Cvel_scaffold598:75764-77172(+) / protein_length=389 / sequence_SO=supercontig / SO=protein_coding / is_pseudo=false
MTSTSHQSSLTIPLNVEISQPQFSLDRSQQVCTVGFMVSASFAAGDLWEEFTKTQQHLLTATGAGGPPPETADQAGGQWTLRGTQSKDEANRPQTTAAPEKPTEGAVQGSGRPEVVFPLIHARPYAHLQQQQQQQLPSSSHQSGASSPSVLRAVSRVSSGVPPPVSPSPTTETGSALPGPSSQMTGAVPRSQSQHGPLPQPQPVSSSSAQAQQNVESAGTGTGGNVDRERERETAKTVRGWSLSGAPPPPSAPAPAPPSGAHAPAQPGAVAASSFSSGGAPTSLPAATSAASTATMAQMPQQSASHNGSGYMGGARGASIGSAMGGQQPSQAHSQQQLQPHGGGSGAGAGGGAGSGVVGGGGSTSFNRVNSVSGKLLFLFHREVNLMRA